MTDIVEVARSDWVVVVAPGIVETIEVPSGALDLVEVAEQGPAGPTGPAGAPGPQGEPGLSGANYTHNQMVPSDTWVIAHSLNRFPSVTVVDSGGSVVIGSADYDSADQITITFAAAFGGYAYLN